tara:strand:- start:570 stop:1679 length:1110 start_codon:yes stop_codon:yes gene_type:complete
MDFITKVTPVSFSNGSYRDKRASDLLSQEKSLLPTSQDLVERRKNNLRKQKLLEELKEEEAYLRERLREIQTAKNDIKYGNTTVEPKEKKQFIMSCTNGNCRGFLSSAWKCGTCECYVCSKCHAVKNGRDDDQHVCNKDDVATAEMIKKETKPCPKCRIPIFKVSGCDLMWCTVCHVTFSWNKNEIVSVKHNHNPHFYAFQREMNNGEAPRAPGDDPCGYQNRLPNFNHLVNKLVNNYDREKVKLIRESHRLIWHIRDTVLPRYPNNIGIDDNSDLRVKYLMNEINEEYWVKTLKIRQKKSEKSRETNLILTMFVESLTDIFSLYLRDDSPCVWDQIENLRTYVNRQFLEIGRLNKSKGLRITKTWEIK